MNDAHKHDYDEGLICIWCGKDGRLNGAWPAGTWLQRRLAEVMIKEAQQQLEVRG